MDSVKSSLYTDISPGAFYFVTNTHHVDIVRVFENHQLSSWLISCGKGAFSDAPDVHCAAGQQALVYSICQKANGRMLFMMGLVLHK